MSERWTIFDIATLGPVLRFKITTPDRVLAPILDKLDVEVQPDIVQRLCHELINRIIQLFLDPRTPKDKFQIYNSLLGENLC